MKSMKSVVHWFLIVFVCLFLFVFVIINSCSAFFHDHRNNGFGFSDFTFRLKQGLWISLIRS